LFLLVVFGSCLLNFGCPIATAGGAMTGAWKAGAWHAALVLNILKHVYLSVDACGLFVLCAILRSEP